MFLRYLTHLTLLIAGACLPVWALAGDPAMQGQNGKWLGVLDLRSAVELHSATQGEEASGREVWSGRRLTLPQLAQLREQVRQQWLDRGAVLSTAGLDVRAVIAPVLVAGPVPYVRAWPVRSHQP